MKLTEYIAQDAVGLAELIRARHIRFDEALEAAFQVAGRVNPAINAIVHADFETARETLAATAAERPFSGVPFLVKDLSLPVKGLPMSNGSRFFAGYVPDFDSTLAERYKAAGLIVIGRTASTEMGLGPVTEPSAHGPCRNPWSPAHQTGGSSGGSAAAVAAGIVPVAHATDGGGSIRMPASHCGLFGLKPSRGRLPAGPILGEAWSGLAVPHVVARSVRDSAAMLDATAGAAPGDPYAAPGHAGPFLDCARRDPAPLRIAMTMQTPWGEPAHPDVCAAVEAAAKLLESLGHHVECEAFPVDMEEFYRHAWTISGANVAVAITAREQALGRRAQEDELEPATWAIIRRARAASAEDYARALQWAHALGRRVAAFYHRYDLTLTPVYRNPPLPVGSLSMQTDDFETYSRMLCAERPFTALYNMSGGPAMSVPLASSREGLPIGVHFGADIGREDLLLQLAGQLERATPWSGRLNALALRLLEDGTS